MSLQANRAHWARLLILSLILTLIPAPLSYAAERGDPAAVTVKASAIEGQEDSTNGIVHGLRAEYYTSKGPSQFEFDELKTTAIDPQINFRSFEPLFDALVGRNDRVNARWTGKITPAYSEDYTFSMIGDNGFRLWIDNKLVIDHWVDDWDKEQTGAPIALKAGVAYDFKVEYFENFGGSNLYLRWASASVPKQIVPSEAFSLPDGFAYDGPLSGVIDEAGTTAELQFAYPLQTLPEGFGSKLKMSLSGLDWPIGSAVLKPGDNTVIQLAFTYPVYSKDAQLVHVRYDGTGGLRQEDGRVIGAFVSSVSNHSTFQIETPWADDVTKENVLPEYPRPQLAREDWVNLNGEWEFEAADSNDGVPSGKTLSERILVPFAAESALSGIERVEDLMWYKRNFSVPESWSGKRVKLNFGAVDYLATVYVNGQKVGQHKGGYTAFDFDITDYLKAGENELIVHVLDQTDAGADQAVGKQTVKKLGGIWYTSISGIWQTVWLEPVAAAHIDKLDMTPNIQTEELVLKPAVTGGEGLTVEAVATSGGKVVGEAEGAAGEAIRVPVPDARLWSPDDPFLYDLDVRLIDASGRTVDEVSSYFGMREIKIGVVDGKQRMLLNGEFVFQMGPLDQGYNPDGLYTAPTDDALKFDIEAVKRLNMNMIRKHIKVEPARWYYWADKLGVLVWQDMPSLEDRQNNQGRDISQATKDQWLKEYEEMIDQLRSVTSIVVWTVFNEGWGQFDWGGQQTRDAVNRIKAYDPTRIINNTSGWQDSGAGDLIDYHNYPQPNSPVPSATRAAVLGEYGGLGLHVPGHEWSPLVFSYQMMSSKEQLTDRYIQYIDQLKQFKNNQGLSAAVYTQITDVEYEINGLLSYDRKVEKIDFERVAKAHRELIGGVAKPDLAAAIEAARKLTEGLVAGEGPGQYAPSVMDAFAAVVTEAETVYADASATPKAIAAAIAKLTEARADLFAGVNDPIAAGADTDSFDSASLDEAWSVYRGDDTKWSLSENPGSLTIHTLPGDSYENANSIRNAFLQDAPSGDFSITLKVTSPIQKNHQQAGLLVWNNEDNYIRLGHVWDTNGSTGKTLETAYEKNGIYRKAANMKPHPGYDTSYLKISKTGNTYTSYFWNGTAWRQAADPVTVDLGGHLKVGLYAIAALDGTSIPAKFDYFAVETSLSAASVAAAITTITNPAAGAGKLELPAVPEGFAIRISDSSDESVIALDGTIHSPASNQAVTLVLQVSRVSDGSTANTAPITVTVPGRAEPSNPAATLTGTSAAEPGGSVEAVIGIAGLDDGFTTLDVIAHYDPSQLSFDLVASGDGSSRTYVLADSAFSEPRDGFRVVGTAVKPAEGTIRILMASVGAAQEVDDDGPLLKLIGKVKQGSGAGATIVRLDKFDISKDGSLTEIDHSAEQRIAIGSGSVDKRALREAIAGARSLLDAAVEGASPGQYPAGSKAELQVAINATSSVLNASSATKEEVAVALNVIQGAMTRFRNSVNPNVSTDKTALLAGIAAAQVRLDGAVEGSKLGQFKAGAKAELRAAITSAAAVRDNAGASQQTIDGAVSALAQAVERFKTRIVTLIEGQTQVSIRDLSLLANDYGITSEDRNWPKVAAADLFDEGRITIRSLAGVARMILDDWSKA
ncbi:sugar-binding domain-containing protein [Paenibacillus aurantiacus]|uniref:sugar-binding domain-containing protein n=1 Tax=Paenibacillus aurantiacus TaxID=1936118 RepID=UPI00406BD4DB